MIETKTTFITDSVHGSIPLSPCEKKLISTAVYNRLHNVLQNSVVYFTYPSNRTSRFIHSLGCLKITSDLFRYGLLNADKAVREGFFEEATKTLTTVRSLKRFKEDLTAQHFTGITPTQLETQKTEALDCHLYTSAMLPHLAENKKYLFIILYQAIRFAALLHDAGHPPFSHVTEYAINSTYEWVEVKKNSNPVLREVSEHLGQFMKEGKAFHETLGLTISIFLLNQVIESYKETYLQEGNLKPIEKKHIYDLIVIKHFTISILTNETPFLQSLHDLVDSDMDGDRLDYVLRDQIASGVSREPLRLERLTQAYTLINSKTLKLTNAKSTQGIGRFAFVPSVRALSTIEDFYIQRFQLYKYVIYHHRVAKFDALLQSCVLTLAREHLSNSVPPVTDKLLNPAPKPSKPETILKNDDILLNTDISGLWQVLNPKVFEFEGQFVDYYVQWDDPWLLTILRKHHALLRKEREASEEDSKKKVLEIQLEELLSNRKTYYSLYKRGECFLEVDKEFMLAFNTKFNWRQLSALQGRIASKDVARLKDYIHTAQKKKATSAEITRAVEENGYSLSLIFRLLITLGFCAQGELPFARAAAEDLKKEIDDVIFIPKLIKPGVKNDFQLVNSDGELVDLGTVSRVADELEREALLFPPFFVYLYSDDRTKLAKVKVNKYRKKFGRLLASHFDIWIQKKLK